MPDHTPGYTSDHIPDNIPEKQEMPPPDTETELASSSAFREIAPWLKKVKFRHKIFGGVDERDVWKKIGELNELYKKALIAERARYDALLESQKKRT